MARQLTALNEEVALLGLIDTHIPRGQPRALPAKIRDALSTFIRLPTRRVVALSRRSVYHRFKKLKTGLSKGANEIPFTLRAKHLYEAYTPLPYRGEVSYWKCVQQVSLQEIGNDELEWEELAGAGLRLHLLDCRHDQIMKSPHVQILAGQIMEFTRKSRPAATGAVRTTGNPARGGQSR
jgi:thioesterase domain-containing protein